MLLATTPRPTEPAQPTIKPPYLLYSGPGAQGGGQCVSCPPITPLNTTGGELGEGLVEAFQFVGGALRADEL